MKNLFVECFSFVSLLLYLFDCIYIRLLMLILLLLLHLLLIFALSY